MKAGFVSLIGRPNAGKSTLLNRLVGQKLAIVSPRPQTTRNRITGILNRPDAQIVFVDTPGLHAGGGRLGEFMLKTAQRAVEDVDAVCLVVDATERAGPDELVLAPLREYGGVTVCALNKVDLVHPRSALLPLLERWGAAHPFAELVPISAVDRIEIVRGPASALYGADAFLGVINIITRRGGDLDGGDIGAGLNTQTDRSGAVGYDFDSAIGGQRGKFDYLISARIEREDRSGLRLPATSPAPTVPSYNTADKRAAEDETELPGRERVLAAALICDRDLTAVAPHWPPARGQRQGGVAIRRIEHVVRVELA